ncbi:MAG: twin-arginine translocase TatA/TatE family subunit [Chloroherpetonaceae bacterium]|nr:twin-arginine translocase TatA/TatE family subunit [Chthonomonadaceae bacterium]MDW8207049.1 twin-arginine translocase TatA/TatE family subunit [Chloroherpetonaceae bacterium]
MIAFINSTNDLIFVALILLIFFGANRIPEIMRGLGRGVRELKKGLSEDPAELPARDRTTSAPGRNDPGVS